MYLARESLYAETSRPPTVKLSTFDWTGSLLAVGLAFVWITFIANSAVTGSLVFLHWSQLRTRTEPSRCVATYRVGPDLPTHKFIRPRQPPRITWSFRFRDIPPGCLLLVWCCHRCFEWTFEPNGECRGEWSSVQSRTHAPVFVRFTTHSRRSAQPSPRSRCCIPVRLSEVYLASTHGR